MRDSEKISSSMDFLKSCTPEIRSIYDYWDRKRQSRNMASRDDIDPIEIPELLPRIQLIDVEGAPVRFRYRLVGTELVTRRGFDPTGMEVDAAFYGADAQRVLSNYAYVTENKTHQYSRTVFEERRGWNVWLERIYLPLSQDGESVNMILVLVNWLDNQNET
jgi:hypothetical protein